MARQFLVYRPGEPPLTEEGHELPPRMYVVTSGELLIVRNGEARHVNEETVIGVELMTLHVGAPLPLARFTTCASSKTCTLDVIPREEIASRIARDPALWVRRAVITTTMLETRPSAQHPAPIAARSDGHVATLQRALRAAERLNRLLQHYAFLAWRLIKDHGPRHPDIGQAATFLVNVVNTKSAEEDAAAEHLRAYLVDHVVPLLLLHSDQEDIATALDYLRYILPGRIRTQSGFRCAADGSESEDDRSERITSQDGKPAFKAG